MVWYGMVWHGMAWYGMVWYGMVWYGMVWYGMVWYGMVWYGMVWYGMVWDGMAWYGMAWYGMAWHVAHQRSCWHRGQAYLGLMQSPNSWTSSSNLRGSLLHARCPHLQGRHPRLKPGHQLLADPGDTSLHRVQLDLIRPVHSLSGAQDEEVSGFREHAVVMPRENEVHCKYTG